MIELNYKSLNFECHYCLCIHCHNHPNTFEMKNNLLCLLFTFIPIILCAQPKAQRAYLGPAGEVLTETLTAGDFDLPMNANSKFNQLPGWPKKIAANQTFKNFRGVVLADIDRDGADEILAASRSTLWAFKGDGTLLWSKVLIGTAIYPPAVAVLDENGTIGIVQVTGGTPNNGRVYLLDANGTDRAGWPLSFSAHWVICGPVIADVNGDGVCEVIVQTRTSNNLHVLKLDGTPLNANWPKNLGGTPAITPSVADIDNDGGIEIVTGNSSGVLFCFDANGQAKPGFPVAADDYSFSYQSPLLVDLDGNKQLSIVGSTHGNAPKFYVRNHTGNYRNGWPVAVPDNNWTYSPPTVVDIGNDGNFEIFMSRPIGETPLPMLYGFRPNGSMLSNFPITKAGGLEGFMSIADITGDGVQDILFGSNLMVDGKGFIHAYNMNGTGEIAGFPLRPSGFTYMNGPNLGDVTGDGILNLVALSYEQTFSALDSTIINVYNLQVPVSEAKVLFGTYKGSNSRSGFVKRSFYSSAPNHEPDKVIVYPNPTRDQLMVDFSGKIDLISIFRMDGKEVVSYRPTEQGSVIINTSQLKSGIYLLIITDLRGGTYRNKISITR